MKLLPLLFITSQITWGQNIKLTLHTENFATLFKKYTKPEFEKMVTDSILKKAPHYFKETYHKSISLYRSYDKKQPTPDYILDINISDTLSRNGNSKRYAKIFGRFYENNTIESLLPDYTGLSFDIDLETKEREEKEIIFLGQVAETIAGTNLQKLPYPVLLSTYNLPVDSIGGEHKTFLVYFIDKTDKKIPDAVRQAKQLINNYFVLKQYETYRLYKKTKKDDCYKYLLVDSDNPLDTAPSENTLLVPILLETEKGNLKVSIAQGSTNLKLKSLHDAVQQIHFISPVVLEKYPATLTKLHDSLGWLIRINTSW